MNRIIIDIKARSAVSIQEYGEPAFTRHPDTEIVCITLKEPYVDPVFWIPYPLRPVGYEGLSDDQLSKLLFSNHFSAFNVETKMYLWKYALKKWLPHIAFPGPQYFDDLAARAVRRGLPGNLHKLCKILSIPLLYESKSSVYMKALLNTRKTQDFPWRNLNALVKHSIRTLLMEEKIARSLPDLSYKDQQEWILNWKINDRGIFVSKDAFCKKLNGIKRKYNAYKQELADIAGQRSAENNEALLAFFREHGVRLYGFSEQELQNAILHHPSGIVRKALELKKRLIQHNIPEYESVKNAICEDNRIRGTHKFYSSFTGNWSDRGNVLDKMGFKTGTPGKSSVEFLFPQLDIRIADWIAGENLFPRGKYPSVFDETKLPRAIKKTKDFESDRWLVEQMCQYDAPYRKFSFIPLLSFECEESITEVIANWKAHHPKTLFFRNQIQQEAIDMLGGADGHEIIIDKLRMFIMGRDLHIVLPSGRVLHYCSPRLKYDDTNSRYSLIVDGIISRGWKEREMYGGCFLKDIVTALRHDFLTACAIQIEKKGGCVVRISKDGISVEFDFIPNGFQQIYLPGWADGLFIQTLTAEIQHGGKNVAGH